MFLNKYLNNFCLNLVYDNYDEEFIVSLNENNFVKIYNLLLKEGFYFIEDIIINYLELFIVDETDLEKALLVYKNKYGPSYPAYIGQNMTVLSDILKSCICSSD